LKSLNSPYNFDRFHEELVVLAGVTPSSCVLDIGCGVGRTVLAAASVAAKVIGIDSNESFLKRAGVSLSDAVSAGRVELRKINADREGLPFKDQEFDAVICQNVLECIGDKTAFVRECYRVLKSDGVFLLGHHDYGGVILNSTRPDLTRRIIAAYTDETQEWMASSDGEMGRKLPGVMRSTDFSTVTTETRHFVELSLSEDGFAGEYCQSANDAALWANISQSEVDAWLDDLAELDRRGAFYFGIPWIYVRAIK
jgi:SAM-dependent methyltransferase